MDSEVLSIDASFLCPPDVQWEEIRIVLASLQ
jgi:hypothetical protein